MIIIKFIACPSLKRRSLSHTYSHQSTHTYTVHTHCVCISIIYILHHPRIQDGSQLVKQHKNNTETLPHHKNATVNSICFNKTTAAILAYCTIQIVYNMRVSPSLPHMRSCGMWAKQLGFCVVVLVLWDLFSLEIH